MYQRIKKSPFTTPRWGFSGRVEKMMKQKNTNEHNMVKNPNWQKADQLAFYKRVKGVEFSAYREQHHVHRTGLETAP